MSQQQCRRSFSDGAMCHGGGTAPTWAAVFNPSLDSVTAVVLLMSSCPSPVLPLSYSASRTLHTKPATGEMKITWIVQTYSVSLCCTPKHSLGLRDTPVIAGGEMAAQIN